VAVGSIDVVGYEQLNSLAAGGHYAVAGLGAQGIDVFELTGAAAPYAPVPAAGRVRLTLPLLPQVATTSRC
jgi:hypothetical protein